MRSPMRKSKFTEEQIVYEVKQAEAGVPVPRLCPSRPSNRRNVILPASSGNIATT